MRTMQYLSMVPTSAGIGLRPPHFEAFLEKKPVISWIEVIPENHRSGVRRRLLEQLRSLYPLSVHSIGLSLGGAGPLSKDHLRFLKEFCDQFDPGLVSDHVAWTGEGGVFLNDLLPLPYTEESLKTIVSHIQETQDFLGRQILVENPSTYLSFNTSSMDEAEFMVEMADRSGCLILLDVNNIHVSSHNNGWDALSYIQKIPKKLVGEIHLAGHQVVQAPYGKTLLIDHHGDFISKNVWALYEKALEALGPKPTLIEWDANIPPLEVIIKEAKKAETNYPF
jgi:uncharacterized protein (UPF0276 family)